MGGIDNLFNDREYIRVLFYLIILHTI